jgi:hypothetical protein
MIACLSSHMPRLCLLIFTVHIVSSKISFAWVPLVSPRGIGLRSTATFHRQTHAPHTENEVVPAFRPKISRSGLKAASKSGGDKGDNGKDDDQKRMAMVRHLQMSYYLSAEKQGSSYHPELDAATGILTNCPLWRVQWTEVPGRSNVLNVHEPIYTNMFEKILYGPKPWLVGHLYLPEGSKNLNKQSDSINEPFRLRSWHEEAQLRNDTDLSTSTSTTFSRSSVVGSLLKISDFRRMADGRLLLLVHAMQRFVVVRVQQQLPYSVADVQLLPDLEEIDSDLEWISLETESDVSTARAMAIEESIRFQEYEYDPQHLLPIPEKADLHITDILGSSIARVLPFAPYSKTLDPPTPTVLGSRSIRAAREEPTDDASTFVFDEKVGKNPYIDARSLSTLESRLIESGILHDPPTHPEVLTPRGNLSLEELEYELWLAINQFLITSKTPVSPALLGLLPPNIQFPSHFVVKPIAFDLRNLDTNRHDFVPVPISYPELRRQQRLSYSAAQLLEQTEWGKGIRQILLEIPSTHARLRMVLERFDLLHSSKWGEFQ